MRGIIFIILAALVLAGCSEGELKTRSKTVSADSNAEQATPLRRDSRRRLLRGRSMELDELMALAEDFSDKAEGITLTEAKECRIGLYAMSMHFEEERSDGFDGDFRKADRDESFVQRLTFAYYGFDRMVKRLEIDEAMAELGNAPESVKRQIIREGIDHSTAENLIWCDYDSLTPNDMDTPSYRTFCAYYDDVKETIRQRQVWRNYFKYCHELQMNYLEDGGIDSAIYQQSILRK